ncbi:hypothetical protein I6N95_26500 [Vagococcus sp. BWB3-3]|uniref:Uncharacterized protein n=1 Tax=Vagococcus allomyrinae TaxID=2794353 RepID=A0A940PEI7_9ENTE|nr:hypothetical protein [Vagococcus allomyrinae]MBP1044566.1 hypothetical protein [Vagococcus allomyrinae]
MRKNLLKVKILGVFLLLATLTGCSTMANSSELKSKETTLATFLNELKIENRK